MFASVMPLGDDLDHLEAAIDKVAAAEQLPDVARLHRLAERLDAVRVRAVGELDRSGAYLDDGFPSAAAWVRERCRLSHGAAHATVTLARKLTRLAETSHAFAAGDISRQHAVVIADACTAEREPAIVELEPQLVDAARAATPKQLHAIVRRVTDALDGDEGAGSDDAQHARRRLHLSPTLDGMVAVDGLLDPEAGEAALTALGALMERDYPAGDPRTRAQRRADAFARLCQLALNRGEVGTTRGVRPHISVVVDLAELEGRGHAELVAAVRCDAEHLGRLSRATLDRLMCDPCHRKEHADEYRRPKRE